MLPRLYLNRSAYDPIDGAVSPLTIFGAGLLAWFDAQDSGSFTGSPVTVWADKSGNAHHVTATIGAAINPTGINGDKQSLTFDDTLGAAFISGSVTLGVEDQLSLFIVLKPSTGINSNARAGSWGSSTGDDYSNPDTAVLLDTDLTGGETFEAYRDSAEAGMDGAPYTLDAAVRMSSIFDGANSTIYHNNVAQTPVASTGNFVTPGYFSIGAGVDSAAVSNNPFLGEIGEYVLVKGAVNGTQRDDLDAYFYARWWTVSYIIYGGDGVLYLGDPILAP